VTIPAAPGRKERIAELALRFSPVTLCRPHPSPAPDLPDMIRLTMVDVREVSLLHGGEPIHWRLLTTRAVRSAKQARRIVDLYRKRWTIEEFFRTLKSAGFDIEEADIGEPEVMIKFVAAAAVAAVTIMQLVRARDGTTEEEIVEAFEPDDQPVLKALSSQLEGATDKQKNPHPKCTLAFAAWVIARLGGWTVYYGKLIWKGEARQTPPISPPLWHFPLPRKHFMVLRGFAIGKLRLTINIKGLAIS
jgi:hypothetical protein